MPDVAWGIGAFLLAVIITGTIILFVSRRTHFMNWKFGVFFESEERFNGEERNKDAE